MVSSVSRLGRVNSVHRLATVRSARWRLGHVGVIESQQLVFDEDGLGHHHPRPARTAEPQSHEVEKQDDRSRMLRS